MLALLFIPLVFPLLYACVAATTQAVVGIEDITTAYMPSIALAAGYDIIMLAVSWVLYDFTISA
jgi:heme exporter protein B